MSSSPSKYNQSAAKSTATADVPPKPQGTKPKGNYCQCRVDKFREKKGATGVANNN